MDKPQKSPDAYRTISEVSEKLDVPQHVLRFWETKFPEVAPMKRAGNRRYYDPSHIQLLARIRDLLYIEGYTTKGVQKLLKEDRLMDGVPPDTDLAPQGPSANLMDLTAQAGQGYSGGGTVPSPDPGLGPIAKSEITEPSDVVGLTALDQGEDRPDKASIASQSSTPSPMREALMAISQRLQKARSRLAQSLD